MMLIFIKNSRVILVILHFCFFLIMIHQNDELIFLDNKIFIHDIKNLEFIKYRKKGHLTVIYNYKHSLMSFKYLRGGIFTSLLSSFTSSTYETECLTRRL
jgi:hypothetical protein